jgi:hypothetical protein
LAIFVPLLRDVASAYIAGLVAAITLRDRRRERDGTRKKSAQKMDISLSLRRNHGPGATPSSAACTNR